MIYWLKYILDRFSPHSSFLIPNSSFVFRHCVCAAVLVVSLGTTGLTQTYTPREGRVHLNAETGFLGVASHIAQFSRSGTEINYRTEGGQDVLFPFLRFAVRFDVTQSSRISLLYQPLTIIGEENATRDLVIDDLTFPQNTPVRFVYGFPFYRASYLYVLTQENSALMLGVGGALQIRNASIRFESLDGTLLRTNRDVGLVPLIKLTGAYRAADALWFEADLDGIWAPIRYLNLSDTDVEGALIDASLRAVYNVGEPYSVFVNARYLAGGAQGTSDPQNAGDGFVRNWLQFLTLSLGFVWSLGS